MARALEVRRVRVSKVNPAAYNPRKDLQPGDPEYEALRRSMEEFGFVEPLVWNKRTGNLVGGHQRLKVLLAAGATGVDVSVVDLPLHREKALNVALNKVGGDWDLPKLGELLKELQAMPGIDETVTGFSQREIDALFRELEPPTPEPDGNLARATEAAKALKVARGQVWQLGRHRLMCGDATQAADVEALLRGERPPLMVTDPPYGVDYDPAWRQEAAEQGHLAYAARRVGVVTNDDRVDWYDAWRLFPGDVVYCWHADRHASVVQASLERAGFEIRSQIIWAKPHFPISRGHYHWRHEPCWYAVRQGAGANWVGGRAETTLREIALDPNALGGHGTQKPVECMAFPIRNHLGDVYDPFVGSGTTIIAAEQHERQCYAMDIEPGYCAVAIARWELYTGAKAKLYESPNKRRPQARAAARR
jgi:DNA modification methylase